MRRALLLLSLLAAAALAAGSAYATSVTVQITGTWDDVVDTANVANSTLAVGGSFTATLVYDDATPDGNPGNPSIGQYLFSPGSSDVVLESGDYTFSLASTSMIDFGVTNNLAGQDGFGFLAEYFTTSGPLSAGSTGYGYANPALFDSTATAQSSDALTALPWEATEYNNKSFYFIIEVLGVGSGQYIELSGDIEQLNVLPEPSFIALIAVAFGACARIRRRG